MMPQGTPHVKMGDLVNVTCAYEENIHIGIALNAKVEFDHTLDCDWYEITLVTADGYKALRYFYGFSVEVLHAIKDSL